MNLVTPDGQQPELTREQLEAIIKLKDEQTVFALAGLSLDIHIGTLVQNKANVANAFMKIGVVLKNNPGFVKRFKQAQKAVIDSVINSKLSPEKKKEMIEDTIPNATVVAGDAPHA